MHFSRRSVLTILLMFFAPSFAQGAIIDNLSNEPQTLEVREGGEYYTLTLRPGEIRHIPGMIVVRIHGREMHINRDEEFAFWKNGEFGPQMRHTRSLGTILP